MSFDSNITCKKGATNFLSGTEVKDGDVLIFTATVTQNKQIDAWYVGANRQEGKKDKTFQYIVASKDAIEKNEKKEIVISFKDVDKSKLLIKYDASKISCKRGGNDLPNDSEVNDMEVLVFTAKLNDKAVDRWKVNELKQAVETRSTFSYTVRESDGQQDGKNKAITISYSERDKLFIKFDSSKVTCPQVATDAEIFGRDVLTLVWVKK